LAFIILSSISGIFTSLFWPPLMGWVSTGYEGSQLNHRLGLFNSSWSLGAIATPYFAGLMVEHNSISPIILMLLFMILSFVGITFAKSPITLSPINGQTPLLPDDIISTLLPKFRWMSRVALFTSFVCIGLVRTQLAVFFKFELSFTESDYGSAVLIMSMFTFAVFTLAGQSHAWHYKVWLFMVCQILFLVSMLLILFAPSLIFLTFAVALIGIGESFMYVSHLYYSVSGKTKRSGRMAIHEMILSLGFAAGGILGGILSDKYGRYSPYWFGLSVITVGLCIQSIIWKKNDQNQISVNH
jgi:MFS family permease